MITKLVLRYALSVVLLGVVCVIGVDMPVTWELLRQILRSSTFHVIAVVITIAFGAMDWLVSPYGRRKSVSKVTELT